nr:type II toxin-antitoxin system VapC family toxin [uncultured Kingella sp.]
MYLLDTNILSEIRKIQAGRADQGVAQWAQAHPKSLMYISAITLLELERGTIAAEQRDKRQGAVYRRWLSQVVQPEFQDRVLQIDAQTVLLCAPMHVPDKKSLADSLIAATAIQHNMTVITRNEKDFAGTGAKIHNPFSK